MGLRPRGYAEASKSIRRHSASLMSNARIRRGSRNRQQGLTETARDEADSWDFYKRQTGLSQDRLRRSIER